MPWDYNSAMPALAPWFRFGVLFLEALVLAWVGRRLAQALVRRGFDRELTERDNAAAATAAAGYHLGLFIALAALVTGEGGDLARDAALVSLHGVFAILALVLSAALWRPVLGIDLHRDLFEARNLAAGIVCGAGLAATGLIYAGAVQGGVAPETAGFFAGPWGGPAAAVIFFVLGQGALFATAMLYEWITPYDVEEEVGERANVAAALGFAGALLAAGLVAGRAAQGDFTSWDESLKDFLRMLVPLAALPLVRWLVAHGILLGFRGLNREIAEDRNAAAGILEGVAYVGSALLVTGMI